MNVIGCCRKFDVVYKSSVKTLPLLLLPSLSASSSLLLFPSPGTRIVCNNIPILHVRFICFLFTVTGQRWVGLACFHFVKDHIDLLKIAILPFAIINKIHLSYAY